MCVAPWCLQLAGEGWKLDEQASGPNTPAFIAAHATAKAVGPVRFEAQTPHDLFTNMEVAATEPELQALYRQHAAGNEPALLIPYSNQDVVRR